MSDMYSAAAVVKGKMQEPVIANKIGSARHGKGHGNSQAIVRPQDKYHAEHM